MPSITCLLSENKIDVVREQKFLDASSSENQLFLALVFSIFLRLVNIFHMLLKLG